jgi:uncharacterized protein (DUF486 family)
MSPFARGVVTVLLLVASNVFMTFAWYYHVKQAKAWPLLMAIGVSWLIALPEYILQVPANRYGHVDNGGVFTLPQLKIIQEAVTLAVFTVFTILVAKERPRGTDAIAMGLILVAVAISVLGRARPGGGAAPAPTEQVTEAPQTSR